MGRALKIVTRYKNPGQSDTKGLDSTVISTKFYQPKTRKRLIREANSDPTIRLGQPPGQKRSRREHASNELVALATRNELMLTISHYLSNPLTVLLGKVELLSEATENGGLAKDDIKKFIDSCKREIHKIDLIIKVFQNLYQVRYKTYPPGIKMLDVEDEIKNRLNEDEAHVMDGRGAQ